MTYKARKIELDSDWDHKYAILLVWSNLQGTVHRDFWHINNEVFLAPTYTEARLMVDDNIQINKYASVTIVQVTPV